MVHKTTFYLLTACAWVVCLSACSSSESDSDDASPARPAVAVYSFGSDASHPVLRNKKGELGNIRETGIIVMKGDQVEIRPSCLVRERRRVPDPKVARVDTDVCARSEDACAGTEPVFEHRCDDQCHVCIKCEFYGCFPWRCCDNVCQDVHVGDRCTRTESRCIQHVNQWKELTTYPDLEAPETYKDTTPMSQTQLLLSGMKLTFTFSDSANHPQEVTCPLGQFKPETDREKIGFSLQNVEGCPPIFQAGATSPTLLSLVNEMSAPIRHSLGSLIKTWDGRLLEQPIESVYYPVIDFLGTLSVRAVEATHN